MKEIQTALSRNRGLIAFCIAAFLLGVPAGYVLYDRTEGMMLPILKQLKEMISHETNLETALNIFINNYKVSVYLVVAGTLILPTLFIMFTNGFLMGFIIKYLQTKDLGLFFFLKGVIPHGIFELPALFIAGGIGLRIGLSFFSLDKRKIAKDVSQSIREAAAIHILVVTPLLFLAAFVETYISAALIK
jgi:stage II sporulation protein M